MRYERRSKSIQSLREHLDDMAMVVEHHRKKNGNADSHVTQENRTLKECVAVMLWEEADGTETITVVGDPQMSDLEVKGVLHDAVYAMAHAGEEGFNKIDIQ